MTSSASTAASSGMRWGPLVEPIHDAIPFIPGVDLPWRENAMFLFWDLDNDVYGVVHASTSPNTEHGRRVRCSLAVGNYSCEIIEPLAAGTHSSRSIDIALAQGISVDNAQLRLELAITPLYGTIDLTKPQALGALHEDHPLHHYQGGFCARGTVSVEGTSRPVRALGWRDRTWGFRDESLQWNEYFSLVTVVDDAAIMVLRMRDAAAKEATFGWRVTDSGRQNVTDFELGRDGSGMVADIAIAGDGFDIALQTRRKPAGFWVPMGRDRNTGPTFSAYDEFLVLEAADGTVCGGIAEHGILRLIA